MVEPRAFVLLKSRRQLDLLNPDPHAWTDDDLAASLSRTMRWGVPRSKPWTDSKVGGRTVR